MTKDMISKIADPQRPVPGCHGARRPDHGALTGMFCSLEPLTRAHIPDLFAAFSADAKGVIWDYLPYGPFPNEVDFADWVDKTCFRDDPFFYAIIDTHSGRAVGMASFLRIDPAAGSIEVGHINFSPALQRSRAATEAMYLMMDYAFEALGYRRYEWKCNAANDRSKQAALRLGLTAEGVFRQATVTKGRNRDTAWFSILDSEWPICRDAFTQWLAPGNFDADGRQKMSLAALRRGAS